MRTIYYATVPDSDSLGRMQDDGNPNCDEHSPHEKCITTYLYGYTRDEKTGIVYNNRRNFLLFKTINEGSMGHMYADSTLERRLAPIENIHNIARRRR